MEVKPGYKQTEVGVIPEEWECEATLASRSTVSAHSLTAISNAAESI